MIGVTAGASAFAVLAIAVFDAGVATIPIAALVGAALGAICVYGFSYKRGRTSTVRIVLVGIGVADDDPTSALDIARSWYSDPNLSCGTSTSTWRRGPFPSSSCSSHVGCCR